MRFPRFEGEWEFRKLEELLEFKNGINASKEQYGQGIKFVNVSDILNNDFLTYENIKGSVNIDNNTLNKYIVQYGDILFQRSSETREEVGTANVYLDKEKTATFGGFVIRGKKIGNYDPVFINYLLKTNISRKNITSKSGGSTRYNVGQETLSSVVLSFPSIFEQEKIGRFLSLINERIQTQSKIIRELRVLKVTLAKRIFSKKFKLKDDNGKDFPEWQKKKLGEIGTITTGSSNREDSILNGEYTFFDRSQDVRTSNRFLFDKEAVIVPGEGQEFIPKYFIGKFDLHQRTYAVFDFIGINGKYLYYHLLNDDRHLQSQAVGSTVKSLRLPMFKTMSINLPSIPEQTKIANFLSSLDSKINIETQFLHKLEEQKKYFLHQMFV